MEDIQTNFDKIMAQFNDSVAHTAPKKLSFDFLNDSMNETMPKKRRISNSLINSSFGKTANDSPSGRNVSADTSLNTSLPPSPWESRRLRADLIESKARVMKLKQEIECLHRIKQETETMYESNVRELTKQCDFSSNKILDLERHLTVTRKLQRINAEIEAVYLCEVPRNRNVMKLKQEIERLHRIKQETESMYESKVRELTKQCDFSSNKILDLERHLTITRKREQRAKAELATANNEKSEQRIAYEESIHKLQRTNAEIEENSRLLQNSMANELSERQRHSEKLEMELELITEELGNMKCALVECKTKAALHDQMKLSYEREKQACNEAKSRIKELEYEMSSYADWKEVMKNSQARLAGIPDMEKEIEQLKTKAKNLHNVVGDKLLLEEQVHDLQQRLEKSENAKNDAVALQVKLTSLEEELKEWVTVAQDHCLPNTLVSPIALRSRIEQILQNDIIMASEKSTNQCEKNSIESHVLDLQQQVDTYTKNNENLNIALKIHKKLVIRVQKKLMLVAKERDCYKQLLENFEKDMTISNTLEMVNPESQLRCRLEMLEKTLAAYKEMCASLEKELNTLKVIPEMAPDTGLNPENYEHFKKEIENLRMENERLKRRKEEVELELEHRCLKGDFNIGKYKVVHLTNNPAAEAYENANNRFEKLQAEIERLRRRNQKLEEDQEEMTGRLNETSNLTVNIKEINTLRLELESMSNKVKKMKEFYKSASLEFREVCYMLFGYKIDRIGSNNNYKISSMYADTQDEYLNFRLNDSGILDMLETPYSISLKDMMQSQLATHKSLPAFLSSLTIELFNKTTVTD